jgi:hypothetical protein
MYYNIQGYRIYIVNYSLKLARSLTAELPYHLNARSINTFENRSSAKYVLDVALRAACTSVLRNNRPSYRYCKDGKTQSD